MTNNDTINELYDINPNEEKEVFKNLFNREYRHLESKYGKNEDESRAIIGYIINNFLNDLSMDIERLNFIEFYQKHLRTTLFVDYKDFTKSEIKAIIQESNLSEDDKRLAEYKYINNYTDERMAELMMWDRKTIRSHIPKISTILKKTCAKIYK